MLLKDKVAIVTGSARGIGKGIARACAEEGANVVIADVEFEEAQETARAIGGKYSTQAHAIRCDVTDQGQVKAMVKETINRFGRLDILVNNAGIYPAKPFLKMTVEEFDKVVAINLRGVFLCTNEAARVMKEGAKIISMSSASSLIGWPYLAHYSAAKGGVNAFTRTVALELASKRITVNAIAPGGVWQPEMDAKLLEGEKMVPIKRFSTVEEIASMVVFLASDKGNSITGQVICVDGGLTIQ